MTSHEIELKLSTLRSREVELRAAFVRELTCLSNAAQRAAEKIETRIWADGLACIGSDIDNMNEAQSALEDVLSDIRMAEWELEDAQELEFLQTTY